MDSWEEKRLLVKIAQMYYEKDMTQSEISKALNIYRTSISRLVRVKGVHAMIWLMIGLIGLSWLFQSILGFFQIKHFNKEYAEMRKLGRVAIGKRTARLQAGTVVMFAIDRKNTILQAKKMQGLTVFSKVRNLKGFEGKNFLTLGDSDFNNSNKLTKLAINDALNSYHIISKGGELKVKKGWIDVLIPSKK